eukprot:TRINITY_DN4301_c0_g1_i1.p1 TRINITY_DN4301_c0_g1~~TRINITY_DN4301_c0_g1_i1.p1  ORF type:complete len:685 (-),score=201.77 TRINITY_DN4301_c0_g1_i1:8-2062(-)
MEAVLNRRENHDSDQALQLSSLMASNLSFSTMDRVQADRTAIALHAELRKSKQETLSILERLAELERLEAHTREEWQNALQLLEEEQQAGDLAREISRVSLEELTKVAQTYEEQLDKARQDIAELQKEVLTLRSTNRELLNKMNEQNSSPETQQQIASLIATNQKLQQELTEVASTRNELEKSTLSLESKCKGVSEHLMTASKNLQAKNSQISELERNSQIKNEEIAELQQIVRTKDGKIAELEQLVKTKDEKIAEFRDIDQTKSGKISDLEKNIQELIAKIANTTENLDSEKSRVAELQMFLKNSEDSVESFRARIAELTEISKNANSLQATLDETQVSLQKYQKKNSDLQSEVETLKEATESLEDLTRELDEQNKEFKKSVAQHVEQKKEFEEQAKKWETEKLELHENIEQATVSLNEVCKKLENEKKNSATLHQTIADLTAENEKLAARILSQPAPDNNTLALLKEALTKKQQLEAANTELIACLESERKSTSALKVNMEKIMIGMKENESQKSLALSTVTHSQLELDSYVAEMDLIAQIASQIEDIVPTVRDFYVNDTTTSRIIPEHHGKVLGKMKAIRNYLEDAKQNMVRLSGFSQGQMVMVSPRSDGHYALVKREEHGPHYFLDPDCWSAWNAEMTKKQNIIGQIVFIGELKKNAGNEYNLVPGEEYYLVYLARYNEK